MNDAFSQLDEIFQRVGTDKQIDPDYALKLRIEVAAIMTAVVQRVAMLNAELVVARCEIRQLETDRDAVQRYLGVKIDNQVIGLADPLESFRRGVMEIVNVHLPDRKIMAIKEIRSSESLNIAWHKMGGGGPMGLKEAKDVVDFAGNGKLLTPQGTVPL